MEIYIGKDGEVLGPYREAEIQVRLDEGIYNGDELAWQEGQEAWVNVKELLEGADAPAPVPEEPSVEPESTQEPEPLDEETLGQINKIKELISDGHADTAWQLVRSLNNPRIYEGLLEDCPVNYEGCVRAPEYLRENGDLFLKLLVHIPQEANLRAELKSVTKLHLNGNQISDVRPLAESLKDLTQLTTLNLDFGLLNVSDIRDLKLSGYRICHEEDGVFEVIELAKQRLMEDLEDLGLDKPTRVEVEGLRDVIYDGHADTAWQLVQSLNNPRLYEWLLLDCPVDDEGCVRAPGYLRENGDLFLKLLVHIPQEANLRAEIKTVTKLHLDGNQISDVTPLKDLTQLTSLWLWRNQISDVTPLKDLTQLTSLHLDDNQISDVTPLKDLTQLTTLDLYNNQISDVTPLKDLTQLTTLNLWNTRISDVTPLKDLTQLTGLGLASNQISDVTPLKDLTQLTTLNLDGNQISDVTPLKDLTQLTELSLMDNQISEAGIEDLQEALPECEINY